VISTRHLDIAVSDGILTLLPEALGVERAASSRHDHGTLSRRCGYVVSLGFACMQDTR